MAKTITKPLASAVSSIEDLRIIIWDPVPEWIRLDDKKLHEFGKLQIESRLKELELQKVKLEQLARLM